MNMANLSARNWEVLVFLNDSFLGIDSKKNGSVVTDFTGEGVFIGYCRRF